MPHAQGRQLLLMLSLQPCKSGCSLLLLLCHLGGQLMLGERELGPAREVAGWMWFLLISTTGPSCRVDGYRRQPLNLGGSPKGRPTHQM